MRGQVLKVSSSSSVSSVYLSILKCVHKDDLVHMDCIGMKSSYTALKALIMAINELTNQGYRTNLKPRYVDVTVEGTKEIKEDKTAIRFSLVAKKSSQVLN